MGNNVLPLLCAQSTYQLSFTQLESDICKATLIVVHRLPTSFRNEVSPTCAGHIGLANTPTRTIQTRAGERMSDTNIGLWPTQCDGWEIGIKGFIFNCFTSICRIKQRFVDCHLIWLYILHVPRVYLPYRSILETVIGKPILRAEDTLWNCCMSASWMSATDRLVTTVTRNWAVALLSCE